MSNAEEVLRLHAVKPSKGRPHFVHSAWLRSVPAELLALPADARISFEDKIGRQSGPHFMFAGEYREWVQEIIARRAQDHFTLNEAAQMLADDRQGIPAVDWVLEIQQAHRAGVLPIHDCQSRLPMRPLNATNRNDIPKHWTSIQDSERDNRDLLKVAELDAWLRASTGYGFPDVAGTEPREVSAAAVARPAPPAGAAASTYEPAGNVKRWTLERRKALLAQFRAFDGKRPAENGKKGKRGALAALVRTSGVDKDTLGLQLDKAIKEKADAARWAQLNTAE